VVEKLLHGIVGNENIRVAIAVVVCNRDPQPFAGMIESYLRGNLGKVAVAVIVVNQRSDRRKEIRMALGAVPLTVFTANRSEKSHFR
jgi:hypothetical protein